MAEMTEREKMVEACHRCGTELIDASGIGPFCPNKSCPVGDGPFDGSPLPDLAAIMRCQHIAELGHQAAALGYAIVPVEPSEGMLKAVPLVLLNNGRSHNENVSDIYRAMLTAWKKECGE